MKIIFLIAAVCIIVILLSPTEKNTPKKAKKGTTDWSSTSSMRIVQLADQLGRKIKDLIGG